MQGTKQDSSLKFCLATHSSLSGPQNLSACWNMDWGQNIFLHDDLAFAVISDQWPCSAVAIVFYLLQKLVCLTIFAVLDMALF